MHKEIKNLYKERRKQNGTDFNRAGCDEACGEQWNARSIAMEAISLAKQGKISEAKERHQSARDEVHKAHHFQTELVTKEANGDTVPMSLIMCHGQDHLMTAMVVIDLAEEFIAVYEKIAE